MGIYGYAQMNIFRAIQVVNVLYVVSIMVIALYNTIEKADSESKLLGGLIAFLAIFIISIPNTLAVIAVPPKYKFAKTAIVLNLVCVILFIGNFAAYEQERLAIHWGVTVIAICALNAAVLLQALVGKRDIPPTDGNVVHP